MVNYLETINTVNEGLQTVPQFQYKILNYLISGSYILKSISNWQDNNAHNKGYDPKSHLIHWSPYYDPIMNLDNLAAMRSKASLFHLESIIYYNEAFV